MYVVSEPAHVPEDCRMRGRDGVGMTSEPVREEDLEPLGPAEAVDMYVEERRTEVSEKTLQNHKYRLDTFVEFCEERDIDDLNALTGRDLHRYRTWRREQDIRKATLRGNLATLRVFLEFAARIDAVASGMREKVKIPNLEPEEESRDNKIETERALDILEHLDRFQYASRDHVIMAILWHTGIRLGTLRAFDVEDYDADAECLDVRHRPKSGTALKNKHAAERSIAIGDYYQEVLEDYLEHNREPVTEDDGRRPLITSSQGRLSDGAIRTTVYRLTQPCLLGECPHDEDPQTCEAKQYGQESQCPSSESPHGIRRGAITKTLLDGTPEEIVSDRMNVSRDVLDTHYDQRTEREKMEIRREFLEDV